MNNDELLRIIEQAAEEGWTSLDLSNKGLTELPPEIGVLTNTRELHLKHNKLTQLPPEISRLTKLAKLDLERNQLTMFPDEIGKLIELRDLSLRHNQISTFPQKSAIYQICQALILLSISLIQFLSKSEI